MFYPCQGRSLIIKLPFFTSRVKVELLNTPSSLMVSIRGLFFLFYLELRLGRLAGLTMTALASNSLSVPGVT